MKRNVLQQAEKGKEVLKKHPNAELRVSELHQFFTAFEETAKEKGSYDALWDAVGNAFYMGVAVGARNAKGVKI